MASLNKLEPYKVKKHEEKWVSSRKSPGTGSPFLRFDLYPISTKMVSKWSLEACSQFFRPSPPSNQSISLLGPSKNTFFKKRWKKASVFHSCFVNLQALSYLRYQDQIQPVFPFKNLFSCLSTPLPYSTYIDKQTWFTFSNYAWSYFVFK